MKNELAQKTKMPEPKNGLSMRCGELELHPARLQRNQIVRPVTYSQRQRQAVWRGLLPSRLEISCLNESYLDVARQSPTEEPVLQEGLPP